MVINNHNGASAIVLINTAPGKEDQVYSQIENIPEVSEVLMLFGEYDLFLKLNCRDFGDLSGIVISRIRSIIGVDSTMTLTVAPITK
ncbi:MAG: Lrp/AsnC ligand binding domain-containing protein [Euryarchaeota archaeon]|jgi:DNA-binding Lrp family transcriptional regulator|nr:Lrp/AsnC ligand binding domain-containing protein [Euryarchaeota archaeon]MBT3970946.1 Lrp/AsnC ligand binding domain-containing protein [Euryarchaeota archaeon]MBT4406295.1 Lrp/AsnC ligand binding domain-containing protein [Euryarchaeota archaeon]MBT6645364.1 Lrp/AsnC ligand binding domain-containing protein [Euryarchaeota archaeon]